jgi:cell division protein FtsB
MTKYEDLIKQREKKPISLDTIFRKYKMTVNDVKNIQEEIEKVKKEADRLMMNKLAEIENLKNKIADLEDSLKSKDYFEKPDYKFLVEENLDLRRRITELEQEVLETKADNTKMARQVDDQISQLRRAGLI